MTEEKTYSISATIDRFEEKKAVLITEDKQTILWDIKNLPEDAEVGSVVRLLITTSKTQSEEQEKIAKKMLNQIIKNGKKE